MRILLLGRGKTGSLVAEVAVQRGHSVRTMTERENVSGSALTPPFLAMFDTVIDFTTPEAVVPNMKACLAAGSRMVVGTTGWYDHLTEVRAIAERRGGSLLYSSNFSVGMQIFLKVAASLAQTISASHGYKLRIEEKHHAAKLDAPSGTAKTLQRSLASFGIEAPVESLREGDVMGEHVLEARSDSDQIVLRHEAFSRRGFAEGALRGAEWLAEHTGVYDYSDIFTQL